MKKIWISILALCLLLSFSACGNEEGENPDKQPSPSDFADFAANQCVEDAISEWISQKYMSIECESFTFNIDSIVPSSRTFSGEGLEDVTWYEAYGTVNFYRGDKTLLAQGTFCVLYNHNGVNSCGFNPSYTVIELNNQ